jgi:hypothetical protein
MSRKRCAVSIISSNSNFHVPDRTSSDEAGNETTRSLGLVVARGTLLVLISPADGSEEIANPFIQQEEQ